MKSFLSVLILCLVFFACKDDAVVDPVASEMEAPIHVTHDQFYFKVSEEQLNFLYDSRDTTYPLENPVPTLRFDEEEVAVKKMKTRGNSASRVRRKSFNVDTEEPMSFVQSDGMGSTESEDFRLLAMSEDLCYIENRIGFGLLKRADLFPLFFKYVEVLLNESSNGVYFLIENPNDYFLDKNDYAFLMRRFYYGKIDTYKYKNNGDGFVEEDYVNTFLEIYKRIENYTGEELFLQLDEVLDVRQYMQKIAYDYLIKNGDYTDEIYMYDEPGDDKIRLKVLPWDLDDIFSELPHEIGTDWGNGNIFGYRKYDSVQDVIDDVGEKLLFSIEDDLDYVIAKDPYMYAIYLEEIEKLVNIITAEDIRQEFAQIGEEIQRFFEHKAIVDQTSHDIDFCDPAKLREELNDKANLLINRRQGILDQL